MTQIILYHNPRCSTSRKALALLQEHGASVQLKLYMEQPPDTGELEQLLHALDISPRALLRSSEAVYREKKLDDEALTDRELLLAMATDPRLIQRPIAIRGQRAVLGRPPENVLEILS